MRPILIGLALALAGCSATGPTPSTSEAPGGSIAETDAAGRLVVGITPVAAAWAPALATPFLSLSNVFLPPELPALPRFVHASLYRYDDTLSPVPDLAAEPCAIGDDQVTITCRLADATFHDGSPVTAADVAYTFELARRSECAFTGYLTCLDSLEEVEAIDERTVQFTLSAADATFLTLALPLVMIESRAVIEAQYAPLSAATIDRAALDAMLGEIAGAVEGGEAACEPLVRDADALFDEIGLTAPPREAFERIGEVGFDPCAALHFARYRIERILASADADGLDAVASVYGALPLNWEPIGAGPWRLAERLGGGGLLLEGAPGHHPGPPKTRQLELRLFPADGSAAEAMAAGEVDWIPNQFVGLEAVESIDGARILSYEAPGFAYLAFNLREGRLFADANIRAALEYCIDKPATVDAATGGVGSVIYSPIEPISWAYRDDLPSLERDVAEARRLIEESGWKIGPDGVYERDGQRLSTDVFVGDFDAPRVRFMDLVVEQARDCGFDLRVVPADISTVLEPLNTYPHVPGGYEQPFDAVFLAWIHGWDPSDILFDSRFASSEEYPDGPNVMGYRNPEVDALLDAGVATYDQRERARIYREYQTILAEDRPVLFAWAYRLRDAITADVRMADGSPINERSSYWWWRLEDLTAGDDPT